MGLRTRHKDGIWGKDGDRIAGFSPLFGTSKQQAMNMRKYGGREEQSNPPKGVFRVPESRENYKYFQPVPTRWNDNDVYGHVNNVQYYSYFDTVITLIWSKREGWTFSPARSSAYAPSRTADFCVSSHFLRWSRQACVWSVSADRVCVTE